MFKEVIKKVIVSIASHLSHNSIIFESLPDLTDSSKAVFDEMMNRGMNKKYSLIWICHNNPKEFKKLENVSYVNIKKFGGVVAFWYIAKAKCLISCNTFLTSHGNFQKSIYLTHGMGLKKTNSYKAPSGLNYAISTSDNFRDMLSREINISPDIIFTTGLPRNDALQKETSAIVKTLFNDKYNKIIVWYPTFRQHNSTLSVRDSHNTLPIIHDTKSASIINDFAKKANILLILKPHYSQDTAYISDLNLSNIKLINDDFFVKHGITSYEFVGGCDALITDYSGIYFDYLLCNKPIGAVWEDIEEYRKNRGFALDIDYYMQGAVKIYSVDEFVKFLGDVADGKDKLCDQRNAMKKIVHFYDDNKSTQRVLDFIIEKCLDI